MWVKLSGGMFVPHGGDAGAFSFEQDEMSLPVIHVGLGMFETLPHFPQ
jgi:hypothetical protein